MEKNEKYSPINEPAVSKITTELNNHLDNPVSTKTVCREFYKSDFIEGLPLGNLYDSIIYNKS